MSESAPGKRICNAAVSRRIGISNSLMPLITASNLSRSFGAVDIFTGISLSIPHGARIAIVGPNGIGKTTLIRILIALDEPTTGSVQRARDLKIGYLPQEAALQGSHSVWQECLNAMQDLLEIEAELTSLEAAMSNPGHADQALERYSGLQAEFERRGGYSYETRIRQVLAGLGFDSGDYQRPITQLSGGQRTRLVLARLLLSEPDLLVLDEPTNHLDMQAVEWLEGYLSQWAGAVLIVSHDRYFLDRVVDRVWEMRSDGLEEYRGNYTAYVQQRQERWNLRQKLFEAEQERLLKELDYVKRNISGQRTLQAKGKLRRLSREVEAIESLGIEGVHGRSWLEVSQEADISTHTLSVAEVEKRIRSLRPPSHRLPQLNLHLRAANRSGELVLRTYDLKIGYPDEGQPLFTVPDLVFKRGECAAIIGPNGAGKTTFLKTLLGLLEPLSGKLVLGASLEVAYFAQAHEDLRPERTLVQEIESVKPNMLLAEIRSYLARFLFSGEQVFNPVSTLSGGERGRLALAKLMLNDANLLLLDEPTNHLDIPSQEILQEALDAYQGTILLVSHDRYLIDALATQVWAIEPDEGAMQVFEGNYSQYREWKEAQRLAESSLRQQQAAQATRQKSRSNGSAEQKRRKLRLAQVENHIAELETRLSELATRLENPPSDPIKVQRWGEEYVHIQNEINALLAEWESLHEQS